MVDYCTYALSSLKPSVSHSRSKCTSWQYAYASMPTMVHPRHKRMNWPQVKCCTVGPNCNVFTLAIMYMGIIIVITT